MLVNCLVNMLINWLVKMLIDRLVKMLIDWLVKMSINLMVKMLINRLVKMLINRLVKVLINLDKLDLTRDSDVEWPTGVRLAGEDVDTRVEFPVHWMISGFREGGS